MALLEDLEAMSSGATFHRADLHIHSFGASADVRDAGATPLAIVQTAAAEQLDLIAIADHNEIGNVAPAMQASAGTGVFVLPAVELTTPEGHVLAYCESLDLLQQFVGRLTIVERGTRDCRCQNSMLECLDLLQDVDGFALLAHVDGDGGLEGRVPGMPGHKRDILLHRRLLGFEVLSAQSPVSYSPQDPSPQRADIARLRQDALNLGKSALLARVLFSDSHSLAALGRNAQGETRMTRLKMDVPSFHGVRVALQEADSRVRLESLIPRSVPHVMGLKLVGGFLDGQLLRFNSNLTCVIGGRGAGKSTALEALRSTSSQPGEKPIIDSEVWPDELQTLWIDDAGRHHQLVRRKGEPIENGSDPNDAPLVFPTESYGQGEAAETSRAAHDNPLSLLTYLDSFVDISEYLSQESAIREQLKVNYSAIERARVEVAKIPQLKRALEQANAHLDALEKVKATEIVALERKLAGGRSLRNELRNILAELRDRIEAVRTTEIISRAKAVVAPEELDVGGEQFKRILEIANEIQVVVEGATANLLTSVTAHSERIQAELTRWKDEERKTLDAIETKRRELAARGIQLDVASIRKLASDAATHRRDLANLAKWEQHLAQLRKARLTLLTERWDVRSRVSTTREAYARRATHTLRNALVDVQVSVKYSASSLSPEAEEIIQEAMAWRTVQVPRAHLLVAKLSVPRLLDAVRRNTPAIIGGVAFPDGTRPFSGADARLVVERLRQPAILAALEACEVSDLPRITVTKMVTDQAGGRRPVTRDFSKLSLGQQQSVLLTLLIASDSTRPLVIDQPEDNLDGEFIYHSLVPALRAAKERRQVVIVTHNPNVAVLGDADQIIALKSLSDRGEVVAAGSIDQRDIRRIACQILEGAEEAFKRRAALYGI